MYLLRLVLYMSMYMAIKTLFKNPTLIKAKCTRSAYGAPFIRSRDSKLLEFQFYDSTDIEEIYFAFNDQAAGQIAEIKLFSNPGKPDLHY